jgi:hypothetical protein
MRVFGIILIVAGILMFLFNGFSYKTEKRVANIGPVQIDKTENHTIGWPVYAGAITLIAGIAVIAVGGKKA